MVETLAQAGENVADLIGSEAEQRPEEKPQVHLGGIEEGVADKGDHSGETLAQREGVGVRTYFPEKKQNGRRHWAGKAEEQRATYANRRRITAGYGKRLLRKRGERIERSFAHGYETGGMRRAHLRGRQNILKRLLIHVGAFHLGLLLRSQLGACTPRELRDRLTSLISALILLFRSSTAFANRAELSSPASRRDFPPNRRYLRYRNRFSKLPGSTTGC